tara:strand:- start:845 stop:1711 length:867 start_codon:yes stop_codon:yes gene_type:complete
MQTITMIDPENSNTYEIPLAEMTNYMLQGLVPVDEESNETEINDFVLCQTCQESHHEDEDHACDLFLEEDVDAQRAIDRDFANAVFEEPAVMVHTKENVVAALQNVNILNAAIAILGDLQTDDELAAGTTNHLNGQGFSAAFGRTGRRLWQWTTGKDAKSMEERWPRKCLSHVRADAAFQRQTKNYEFTSAVQLAQHVCAFHWRQLASILEPGFEGMDLPKADQSRSTYKPRLQDWVDITGARVLTVKGGGTQLLWDGRKIWLPTSQLKKINGALQIPSWLAQKNDMI